MTKNYGSIATLWHYTLSVVWFWDWWPRESLLWGSSAPIFYLVKEEGGYRFWTFLLKLSSIWIDFVYYKLNWGRRDSLQWNKIKKKKIGWYSKPFFKVFQIFFNKKKYFRNIEQLLNLGSGFFDPCITTESLI